MDTPEQIQKVSKVFSKLKYCKTKVFQRLASKYFSFGQYFSFEKRGSDLFLQYFKELQFDEYSSFKITLFIGPKQLKAQFGSKVFSKLKYFKTKVFHCLANKYFSFGQYFSFEKRGLDLFLQYFKKTTVLVNTSVLKPHYLLDPNTLKY